jgi:hypothetical protein
MRSRIPTLAALLGVQLVIAAVLVMRHDALSTIPPNAPFLTNAIGTADRILIDGPAKAGKPAAAPVELLERNGAWVVHSAFDVPASKARVSALIEQFGGLRRGLPVANTPDARARFEVAADRYARRIRFDHAGHGIATVYLGKSAGLRKSYGRAAGDRSIYTLGVATYHLSVQAGAWIDAKLLQIPADDIAEIDVRGPRGGGVELTRVVSAKQPPGPWHATGLPAGHSLDAAEAGALVRAIDELRVDDVLGVQALPDWQANAPQATFTIGRPDGHAVTWTLSTSKTARQFVLKSSGEPWYFSIDSTTAQPLLDAAAPGGLVAAPGHAPAN